MRCFSGTAWSIRGSFMRELTQALLQSLIRYNPRTGVFTWMESRGRRKVGDVAGAIGPKGYVLIGLNGRQWLAHRLAWLWVYGTMPTDMDHLNGVRHDNRIVNLREATAQVNAQNRRTPTSGSLSERLGVSWNERRGKWLARIMVGGKSVHLGYFDDRNEAHAVYVKAKRQHHEGCSLPTFDALAAALTRW